MLTNQKNILIIMGRYLPGYKDGGPVRTIKNLTDQLRGGYSFKILTCDRDHGDIEPYPDIQVGSWNKVGNADVYYVPPKGFKCSVIKELSENVDIIYLCGCFNDYAINTLLLKKTGAIKKPVVIAAMGLFSPLQFQMKHAKKKLFVDIFNALGIFKRVYWSATSEKEKRDIVNQVGVRDNQIFIAEDLPRKIDNTLIRKRKESEQLNVVWISRIASNKNLHGAIQILQRVRCNVSFTIYGPIADEDYWDKCMDILSRLPHNVEWEYGNEVASEQVVETLKPYHVFLFPSPGENYGHVIQEALSAGCACVLSDQTPWSDLEKYGVGFAFSLGETDRFVGAIEQYASLNETELNSIAQRAVSYAMSRCTDSLMHSGYKKIFTISSDPGR